MFQLHQLFQLELPLDFERALKHLDCGMNTARDKDQIRSYKSYVTARAQRNPCLRDLCEFLQNDIGSQGACRIACLEFSPQSGPPTRRSLDLDGLGSLLRNTARGREDLCGRIMIVEDLSSDVVETLGSLLSIDPLFFASHIGTFQRNIATIRPSTVTLPSTTRSQKFLNLHYHRVIEIEELKSKQSLSRDMNVPRKVKVLPPLKGINVGLARHCCSILRIEGKDGLWLGSSYRIGHEENRTWNLHLSRTCSCRRAYKQFLRVKTSWQ